MPPKPMKLSNNVVFSLVFWEKSLSFRDFWVILQPLRCILQCTTSISDRLQHQLLAVNSWMGKLEDLKNDRKHRWKHHGYLFFFKKNMVTNLDFSFFGYIYISTEKPIQSSFNMILNTLEFDDNQNIFNCLLARCSRGNPVDRKSWKERPGKNILLIRYWQHKKTWTPGRIPPSCKLGETVPSKTCIQLPNIYNSLE